MSRFAGRLTPGQLKMLEAHVGQEEQARGNNMPLSPPLATEFHILLVEMTESPVLARYVSEVLRPSRDPTALYRHGEMGKFFTIEGRRILRKRELASSGKCR